jgi:hypothetical protein
MRSSPFAALGSTSASGDDAHAEAAGAAGDLVANMAEADDGQRGSFERGGAQGAVPAPLRGLRGDLGYAPQLP